MKDYLIYLDEIYTGIKRGPNVDAIMSKMLASTV